MTIPIIRSEESFQRISFVPIQTIVCRCTVSVMRFIMLFGLNNRTECGGCGRYYYIAGMLANGTPDIQVEVPMKAPGMTS